MPKRPRTDDPATALTGRIPRPVGSAPLPDDLPADGWARLFAVALVRLQRARPQWASATAAQVENLLASWVVFARDASLSKEELDLRLEEVLEDLEAHPPWGQKARARAARGRRGRGSKKGSRK